MSNYTITADSELMQNYLQADILNPEKQFQALQTNTGTSLLFSIGTDDVFYLTKEIPQDRSGWSRTDISSKQIAKDFPGKTGVTCRDFSSAQCNNPPATSIHLAMVLNDGTNDFLYLSLNNSDSDTSWTSNPSWMKCPFNAQDYAGNPIPVPSPLEIAGVFLSEATDKEYIVVDIVRDPANPTPVASRFYIDVTTPSSPVWRPHDISIDLETKSYTSCLGRHKPEGNIETKHPVDGLYTMGSVSGSPQFIYTPLYNYINPTQPASPSPLQLTAAGDLVPDAIAACRNPDNTSDLYAMAGGALYYFASDNQRSGAIAVSLLQNPLFSQVRDLFASVTDGMVTVWGRNASDQLFYVSCPQGEVTSGDWSVPLPILSGAEQVSPYLDRANSANTFFAHTGQNKLTKAVKSPNTTMWCFRQITLPPPSTTTPSERFSSYTTRVQVNDSNNQPAVGLPVNITATNVTSVYINYLYYVIGQIPIQVPTDSLGSLTIVEAVNTVAGTRLNISANGTSLTVNPMDKAFKKAASLDTPDKLSNAQITYYDGTTKALVPSGTSSDDLKVVADGNTQLSKAYAAVATSPLPTALARAASLGVHIVPARGGAAAMTMPSPLAGIDSVPVDPGDFLSWLGHEIESGLAEAIHFVEDTATGIWTFVATIAGQAYHAVLDCVEKVVGAVEWLYDVLKTAIEDLLKFLEFLFEFADMKRTKQVIQNLFTVFLNYQVDQIEVVKGEFDQIIEQAETAINNWAGVGDWSGLGTEGTAAVNSKSTPSAGQTAPGSLLQHHYQNNVPGTTESNPPAPPDPPPNPIQVLIQALTKEADTIGDTISRLQALAENFTSMPLADALKELVAIIADLVLESAKNVIDALFDILYDIAKAALEGLATPIYIPVLSDILSDFGVPEFSFLDIACWIVAIPVTIVYKAAAGSAPFPDNSETDFLINAPDYQTVLNAFAPAVSNIPQPALQPKSQKLMRAAVSGAPATAQAVSSNAALSISSGAQRAVFVTGYGVAGFCSLISTILDSFEAAEEDGDNAWAIPSAVCAVLGGVSSGLTGALVPVDAIENTAITWISRTTTGIRILCKLIFSGPAQKKFASSIKFKALSVSDGRGVGAIVDAVLVVPALVCTCWHFYELSEKPAGANRSIAIVNETSNLTSYIGRVGYAVAVNTEGDIKIAAIVVLAVADVCTGGLQIAEAVIT